MDNDQLDERKAMPDTIRHAGDELAVVTPLQEERCRLVLKPVYTKYPALKTLVREHESTVIDLDVPASEAKAKVLQLASETKDPEDTPEPSGGARYELAGHTYPVHKALKELGLRWDEDETIWWTHDPKKWQKALRQTGAKKTGDHQARVPPSAQAPSAPASQGPSTEPSGPFRISTDGACRPSTEAGGWAAVIEDETGTRTISGEAPGTTSNRMELTAILKALKSVPEGAEVLLRSDSKYAINVITEAWTARANVELVETARAAACRREVDWEHVEAHAGDPENEAADDLAEKRAQALHRRVLDEGPEAYVIEGDTYSVREELKEEGLRWSPAQKAWWTRNKSSWNRAVAAVGAEKTGARTAEVS